MVSGIFFPDSMEFIVDAEFHRAAREDLTVSFIENTERKALYELAALPGVRHAEPFRSVGIKLRHGNLERRTVVQGLAPGMELHRVLDANLHAVELPEDGLVLSDVLAKVLGIRPGECRHALNLWKGGAALTR